MQVKVGEIYGRLKTLGLQERRPVGNQGQMATYFLCQCECGSDPKWIGRLNLKNGDTKSCGCLDLESRRQRCEKLKKFEAKHGMSGTPEYQTWNGMNQRCTNPNASGYLDYGGRGIRVCEAWAKSFDAFFADMGRRPSPKHTIDRINSNLDYGPSNCRWATRRTQNRNKSDNVWIEYDGKRMLIADWAVELNTYHQLIASNLRRGKSFDWIVDRIKQKHSKESPCSTFAP